MKVRKVNQKKHKQPNEPIKHRSKLLHATGAKR